MVPAYIKNMQYLPRALGITCAESTIRLFAINSNAFNTLVTFNSNNGIDNSEIKNAKDSMGD